MIQQNPLYKTRLFYKFTCMFLVMACLVAATGLFGIRKVDSVTRRLQFLTQTHTAQEKLALLMKASLSHAQSHLLEAMFFASSVEEFENTYVDYDLQRGWFSTYCDRLLSGNEKLKLQKPAPGSPLEQRILQVQAQWNTFEKVAESIRDHELQHLTSTAEDSPPIAKDSTFQTLEQNLDDAAVSVLNATDDLLVTISAMQEEVKKEIAATREDATRAITVAIYAAIALAILLGVLVTRGMVVNLALIMRQLRAIAQGDRDPHKLLAITAKDEIADVAQGINTMLLQLIDRDLKIAQHSKDLEDQVASRTQELSRTNDQLALELVERQRIEADLVIARQAAEEASRLKSEFLANMSHEIRTPMNAILGFSELLEEHVSEPRYRGYLDGIRIGGKNLLNLINDILDLSKIEAGKMEIRPEPVKPDRLFQEIVQIFTVTAGKKDLTLDLQVTPKLPKTLLLDETRIRQVMLNLVGNAMKFTHQGGITIHIDTQEHDQSPSKIDLIIRVSDTGIGIPEGQIEAIFEAFRQQEGQNTRKYGGTGLGLTITRRLVEMMRGEITVTSQPGQGSNFIITLHEVQVASMDNAAEATEVSPAGRIVFRGQTILMAEDIESNRQVVHGFLESHNLLILDATNGQEAVAMAKEKAPTLILMDIQMPVMDGYTAIKLLKDDPATRGIPALALTASVMDVDVKRMREAFDGYLRKPVSKNELLTAIGQFLDHDLQLPEQTGTIAAVAASYQSEQNIRMSETLVRELTTMEPRWQAIRELLMNDEVEEFGLTLEGLGKEHQSGEITAYGQDLAGAAASFQLERMSDLFAYFPELLKKIDRK